MRMLPLFVLPIVAVIAVVLTQPWESAEAAKSADLANGSTACIEPAKSFEGKTIEQWRAEGPDGFAKLLEAMQPTIEAYKQSKAVDLLGKRKNDLPESDLADLLLLDQVAQQRDAYAAGLYWYTDHDEAVAEAKRTGKPILSLRMLGKLVDEYSCANSRFFRTVLYADETVGKLLRDKFVLHWQSVRPVPVITIDMGDGRTIKRTITGNSAHYVLDTQGRVIDCLPGLYAADLFESQLKALHGYAAQTGGLSDKELTQVLRALHAESARQTDNLWAMLVNQDQPQVQNPKAVQLAEIEQAQPANAREAGSRTPSKFVLEAPLINIVLNGPTPQEAQDHDGVWERVAKHYAQMSRLDQGSRMMVAHKTPAAELAMPLAVGKALVESPLLRKIRNFETSIAMDTARNEHLFRREVRNWFIKADQPLEVDALNKRVYAELFLTPDEDPWLGLVPADTYSALDEGGLIDQ